MIDFHFQDFAFAFLSILLEGFPFILVGTILSGLIDVFLPDQAIDRFLPKNRYGAILISASLGLILPVCECAVVPVIRRLTQKGLPISCGLTYMLAAPIINPITAISTWKAFQGQSPWLMTGSRVLLAAVVALAVGWIASWLKSSQIVLQRVLTHHQVPLNWFSPASIGAARPSPPVANTADAKWVAAMRCAMKDFSDVMTFFVVGVALTALFNTGVIPGLATLDRMAHHAAGAPATMMVLAFLLSLCSTSDAFIAASLDQFSLTAKLAFLTLGPMLDLKLLFLYQTILRPKFLLALIAFLVVSIYLLSFLPALMFPPS